MLKFMFSTSQVVTINYYSHYFHILGLILIKHQPIYQYEIKRSVSIFVNTYSILEI